MNRIDPEGKQEFNPTKLGTALVNFAYGTSLIAKGTAKAIIGVATSEAGVGAALLTNSALNFNASKNAFIRGTVQWKEALNENYKDANIKNLIGVLPQGNKYDDPCEPNFWEYWKDWRENWKDRILDVLGAF